MRGKTCPGYGVVALSTTLALACTSTGTVVARRVEVLPGDAYVEQELATLTERVLRARGFAVTNGGLPSRLEGVRSLRCGRALVFVRASLAHHAGRQRLDTDLCPAAGSTADCTPTLSRVEDARMCQELTDELLVSLERDLAEYVIARQPSWWRAAGRGTLARSPSSARSR